MRFDVRRQATALLVLAFVCFVVTRRMGDEGWLGYANAASEAALIGGLADWFAVTALFRHPLRLPIPHTAILPTRKDALGDSLAEFVETNFFGDQVVSERLAERELSVNLGRWLSDPSNARKVGDQLAVAVTNLSDFLDDDLVEDETGKLVLDRLRQVPAAPILARVIRTGTADGRIDRLTERAVDGAINLLDRYRPVFRQRLTDESPWWVPDFVDERVYRRIETGLQRFADELRDDPDHVFRRELTRNLTELADRLERGEGEAARVEELWHELLDLPEVRQWAASLWSSTRGELISYVEDPSSPVRQRAEAMVVTFGERLLDDPELRASVDRWIGRSVDRMLGAARSEISDLISSTVHRWDAQDASDRIEAAVGRDLQFIRINGTLVGALLGLVIHAFALLIS
ncbi:MAG: DUF445 domain-containing protein [Actinomycetota bacterium]